MSNIVNKNKDGYGYKYTDISEIHRFLEQNNMSYYQYIDRIDGDDYIMTVKIIDGKEQPAIRGSRVVQATLSGIKNPAQEQGSALTYARRYSLLMAFGLATDDDDAQSLSRPIINSKEEAEEYTLSFGKYTGKKLKELPQSYIQWLLENSKDDTIKTACDYLVEHFTKEESDERITLLDKIQMLEIEKEIDMDKFNQWLEEKYGTQNTANMEIKDLKEIIKVLEKKGKQ